MMPRLKARVYLVLLLGIMVGFVLSSLLQNAALSKYAVSNGEESQKTFHYKDYGKVSNPELEHENNALDVHVEGEYEQGQKHMSDSQVSENVDKRNAAPKVEEEGLVKDLKDSIDAEEDQQRKDGYINWQGRTVQDIHIPQRPVNSLSDEVATRKPVLIAIITSVQQLMSQTIAIQGTWAKNNKQVLYFTGDVQTMPHLPHGMKVIQLEGIDDNQASWEIKEFAVMKYLIKHYLEEVDWFLLIGDDVYVNPDSLEHKLGEFNASFQVYMGHNVEMEYKCNYGPGVVYSRGLLSRLESYLPQCQGESFSISQCIVQRGIRCTQAKEVSCCLHCVL